MESLCQVRVSDLEQTILSHKRSRIKPITDSLPLNQDISCIDSRQWTVYSQRPAKTQPCRCPFHHKPQLGVPTKHLAGCRSHPRHNLKQMSDHISHAKGKIEKASLANMVQVRSETEHSIWAKPSTNMARFRTCQQRLEPPPKAEKPKFRISETEKRSSHLHRGVMVGDMPSLDINARYLKDYDSFGYKYLQGVRYLTRQGYELEQQADVKKTTEFLNRIFSDMRQFQSEIYKRTHRSQKISRQIRRSVMDKSIRQHLSNQASAKATTRKKQPMSKQKSESSTNKLKSSQNGTFTSIPSLKDSTPRTFKIKSLQNISLKELLTDIEEERIKQIAHADREELIEGLEMIENQLERELFKTKTTKCVADFISEGKTSDLIERVLRNVQGSTILTSYEISNRSELLQDGLRKIHKYEQEIMSQAASGNSGHVTSTSTISPSPSSKKLRSHRFGLLKIKKSPEGSSNLLLDEQEAESCFLPQKPTERAARISMTSNNPSQNISNKVFAKIQKHNINTQQTEKDKDKDSDEVIVQQEESDSIDDYETELTTKIKASRRKRAINKFHLKDSNQLAEELVECESDQEEQIKKSRRGARRKASLRSPLDLKDLGQIKSPLVRLHKLKMKYIVKDINELLINKSLTVFKITKDDSNIIRKRKLRKLKRFLQKQPELYDRELIRNINFFEQHDRLTKQARVERTEYVDNRQNKDDDIVLATINAVLNKTVGLKWTDEIKRVDKTGDSSGEVSSDEFGQLQKMYPHHRMSLIEDSEAQKSRHIRTFQQDNTPSIDENLLQRQLICKRAFQDIYIKHSRRKQSRILFPIENLSNQPDSKPKIRSLIKQISRVNRPLFEGLVSQTIRTD